MRTNNHIFTLNYNIKLIKLMAKSGIAGTIGSNLVSPILMLILLLDFIPSHILFGWFLMHLVIFFARLLSNIKITSLFKHSQNPNVYPYFHISLLTSILTAVLFGLISYMMYVYQVPDLHLLLLNSIILILLASSVSTLSMIYVAFLCFTFFTALPLIYFSILHGGEVFTTFGYILSVYLVAHAVFGYIQYKFLTDVVQMQDTFQSIYEKSSDGIMLIQNKRFKDCNDAMVKMFGFQSKGELLHTNISQILPKKQPDGTLSLTKMIHVLNQAQSKGSYKTEWLHQKIDGTPLWVEIVLTKIILEGEEFIHGIWRDTQERKELELEKEQALHKVAILNQNLQDKVNKEIQKNRDKEKQLLQQSRMAQMGEMLSMIAHQWRQPLSAISASSASIELQATLGVLDNEIAQKKSKEISSFAQHLSKTIDDFRNFFKPNKRQLSTTYDILISSVLDIVGTSIRNQNIEIKEDLYCHDSFITYPNELKQVILNLLQNAKDALGDKNIEEPYIQLKSYQTGQEYILEISDNAGGIPPKIMDKIFNIYFSTKSKKDGTGLGLYMSKTIIENHCDGTLSVSNGKEGAIFKISLPYEKISK